MGTARTAVVESVVAQSPQFAMARLHEPLFLVQDVAMGESFGKPDEGPEARDDLANGVLLKKYEAILGAPEEWRRRASTAAGLLSAGAAALLGALLLGPREEFPYLARHLAAGAGLFYLIAVLAFLHASTRPPTTMKFNEQTGLMEKTKRSAPRLDKVPRDRILETSFQEASMQVDPLKSWVKLGKIASALAMLLTISAITALLYAPAQTASVQITNEKLLVHLVQRCPDFTEYATVAIDSATSTTLTFTVPAKLCGGGQTRVAIPATQAMITFPP